MNGVSSGIQRINETLRQYRKRIAKGVCLMSAIRKVDADIVQARRIARNCPVGWLIVHEIGTGRVFYRKTTTGEEKTGIERMETNFTEKQLSIARGFVEGDPDHLHWDARRSTEQYDVYTTRG